MILLVVGTIIIMKGHWILGGIVLLEAICDLLLQFDK